MLSRVENGAYARKSKNETPVKQRPVANRATRHGAGILEVRSDRLTDESRRTVWTSHTNRSIVLGTNVGKHRSVV